MPMNRHTLHFTDDSDDDEIFQVKCPWKEYFHLLSGKINRCICVIGFRRLKRGFRHIFSSTVQKCAWKVRFFISRLRLKWIQSPEQNLRVKNRCAGLHSECQGYQNVKASYRSLTCFIWSLHCSLLCCETDCAIYLSLDTQDIEDNSDALKTAPKTPTFL